MRTVSAASDDSSGQFAGSSPKILTCADPLPDLPIPKLHGTPDVSGGP